MHRLDSLVPSNADLGSYYDKLAQMLHDTITACFLNPVLCVDENFLTSLRESR